MSAAWPGGLPQDVLVEGVQETFADTTIRTRVDAGPALIRRRSTAGLVHVRLQIDLSRDQAELLRAFFDQTLAGGALPFDWIHHRTLAPAVYRFRSPPSLRPLSGQLWRAALELEMLP